MALPKPICQKCKTNEFVEYKNYVGLWVGFECGNCGEIVAVIKETDEEGETKSYNPYRMSQISP